MSKELTKELQEQVEIQRQMIEDLRMELHEGPEESQRELIEREISVLFDPYDVNNPFKIKKEIPPEVSGVEFPEGEILRWKSFVLRERRGMRGWRWVRWSDDIGKNLEDYLASPPMRMQDSQHLDDIVRRGDLGLARMDKRIAISRVRRAELESARMRGELTSTQNEKLGKGVELYGPGLESETTPIIGRKLQKGPGVERTELLRKSQNEE